MSNYPVRGYVKDEKSFHTYRDWSSAVDFLLSSQNLGIDTRGGNLSCKLKDCDEKELQTTEEVIEYFFGHIKQDIDRYDLLSEKSYFDFIEDFINHKFWALEKNYSSYFKNFKTCRLSFLYSRGDIEPYVLIDDNFTNQIYGSLFNPIEVIHYTTQNGLKNIKESIDRGPEFDISTMTIKSRDFFDNKSNIEVRLIGNAKAIFRSDVKSFAVSNGNRAANLLRFEYPGKNITNLCYDSSGCESELKTGIWNEIIATPIKILDFKLVN